MDYQTIKHIHITCALLSGSLFFVRGCWMCADSSMLQKRWIKIAPHLIDTILLTTAIIMAVWSQQYPFVVNWLSAKLVALILYIFWERLHSNAEKQNPKKSLLLFWHWPCLAT